MKQALLILQEAGSKQLEESKGVVEKSLAQHFPDMIFKSFSYQNDHPEEVTYHLGQWVKFLARNNGQSEAVEELTEEQLTFKQQIGQFWEMAKPALRQLGKEIWYSKDDVRRLDRGEEAGKGKITMGGDRISTKTVLLKEKEKHGKENVQA